MSNDMPSWRSLASAASRSFKGYVAQRDVGRSLRPPPSDGSSRSSWGQWAGQKLRSTLGQGEGSGTNSGIERLSLFPGWACRKYHEEENLIQTGDTTPFDVELFVSGFASRSSGPGFGTRTGKAFLRLAKSYAALPKLTDAQYETATLGPNGISTGRPADNIMESVHLPSRPEEIEDEAELEELNEKIHQLELETNASMSTHESGASSAYSSRPDSLFDRQPASYPSTPKLPQIDLRQSHANLEARLHPFWASSLGSRTVHIAVYANDPEQHDFFKSPPIGSNISDEEHAFQRRPIASANVITAPDGSFQQKFIISWEKLCVHPAALHVAFGDPNREYEFFVTADLMPQYSRPSSPNTQVPYAVRNAPPRAPRNVAPTASCRLAIPITNTTVRLISDIDDTVKMSGILSGARAAFHNVFVKDLSESIIPGMGDWYTDMWQRGVRFHYVSNGPFELLPVVNEFLQLSGLPPGSIKLKSYAGRSLFNGLLAAPAERKRNGIMDVLDSFQTSRFFLVGDSGEQDLELYASIARDRPGQILGIFIRDASNPELVPALEDPTGDNAGRIPHIPQRRGTQSSASSIASPPSTTAPLPDSRLLNVNHHRPVRSLSVSMPGATSDTTPRAAYAMRSKRTKSDFPHQDPTDNLDYFTSTSLIDLPVTEEPQPITPPTTSSFAPSSYTAPGYTRRRQDDETSSTSSRISLGRTSTSSSGRPPMTEAERKQFELQQRVYRARMEIPDRIPLRVFRHPSECVEATQILESLNLARPQF